MGLLRDLKNSGLTPEDFRRIKSFLRDGLPIKGPNVTVTPPGVTIAAPPPVPQANRVVWVRILSNLNGGGKYKGAIHEGGHVGTDTEEAVSADDFGPFPTSDNAIVVNAAEEGKNTHDLTEGSPNVRSYLGTVVGQQGGKYVVVIGMYDWQECSDDPAEGFAVFTG